LNGPISQQLSFPVTRSVPSGFNLFKNVLPLEFAKVLTLMAWKLYTVLVPSDLVHWLKIKAEGGNPEHLQGKEYIEKIRTMCTRLNLWVRDTILKTKKGRKQKIEFFIQVAEVRD
jgi:hypothetical protein